MLQLKEINMPRTIFLYVLLVTLLITGCGSFPSPEPLNTPTIKPSAPGSDWTIKMTQSGGIMGLSRSIEVSSDGKYTVVDERSNKTVTGELTTNELSELNELIVNSNYEPATKPNGNECADCFVYDLEMQVNGEKLSVQLNDVSLPNSGLEPLVTYWRGVMDTTLKQ
jgi:hypothetical protein